MLIHHPKKKGEYAEALFLARALALGFNVCKPWGDTARFDFVLEKTNDVVAPGACPERSRRVPARPSRDVVAPGVTARRSPRSGEDYENYVARATSPASEPCSGEVSQLDSRTSRLLRIQVKSCWRRVGNHYAFRTTGNTPRHPTYTARDLDFIAALVVPLSLWYIVPISAIAPNQSFFYVFPHKKRGTRNEEPLSYEQFREAWHLMENQPA